jgi:hypothetical protein
MVEEDNLLEKEQLQSQKDQTKTKSYLKDSKKIFQIEIKGDKISQTNLNAYSQAKNLQRM